VTVTQFAITPSGLAEAPERPCVCQCGGDVFQRRAVAAPVE
jgi:hypothetical protein